MILYSTDDPEHFLFAELRRDMALDERGFERFMRWMLCISLGVGTLLYLAGAWPVIGFLGLDVLLVWGAFKYYQKSHEQRFDRIVVNRDGLTIEQHIGKRVIRTDYEPSFVQLRSNHDDLSQPIHLCQRGACCEIGRWLGAEERCAFARMFKDAQKRRQAALIR